MGREVRDLFAQVIVDIAHENVAHAFTYMLPQDMNVSVGQRVEVPFGPLRVEGMVVSLEQTTDVAPEKLKRILRTMEPYPAVLPCQLSLARRMADSVHCPLAETLRLMYPAQMRGERIHARQIQVARLAIPPEEVEDAVAAQGRSAKRRMLLRLLQDGQPHPVAELRTLVSDPRQALAQLQEAGYVAITEEEVFRRPGQDVPRVADPPLTPSQEEVLEVMLPRLRQGEGKFLLHGVTGSGKTEVFIRLVRETLALGKSAMILVPEIALTPQMVSWFRSRFGDDAAVMHSRLSPGERYDEWRRIRLGGARVVIGARSAVFAPMERLGLVVIDEEHETTYLSDRHPRYDAREVAAWRCAEEGATLVLASATPSILSFAMARRGDYTLLEMPHRVHNRPMPEVSVVDMRQELEAGNRSMFSGLLASRLNACMERGEQAMLLMNRRGYNAFVSCRSCGLVMKCPNCDISLTYHLNGGDGRLHCHYCGYAASTPDQCPECRSRYIRYFGAGTQKVEEELRHRFPGVGIVRMDIDTTSGKDGHSKLLEEFRSGRARILVGTQMIAKGLDFPRVTLVGVVAADMTLNLPDYRARERTFQLLTQVAGRAGRGDIPGQVVVQTYKPEDSVILTAAAQDYRSFFEQEFLRRRRSLYPPFTIMARLLVESVSPAVAQKHAEALHMRVEAMLDSQPIWRRRTLTLRVEQAPVGTLRGKARWHVMMKLLVHRETEPLVAALTALAQEPVEQASVYFEYNPTTMI